MVERYRSGYEPPEDIPFIDLSAGGDEAQLTNGLMTVHMTGASPSPAVPTTARGGTIVARKKSHKILRNIFGGPSKVRLNVFLVRVTQEEQTRDLAVSAI